MSSEPVLIPFFVLRLDDGHKSKALFTVPSQLAQSLVQYPVLCRGSMFDLSIDTVCQGDREDTTTCFLAAEFESPDPEETASCISKRLAARMADSSSYPISDLFGF